jgi:hypothetical protein
MASPARSRTHISQNPMQPGRVRARPARGSSQLHPGVTALNPVSHRNTSFQPLPRPLGLPPYHYDIADSFPDMTRPVSS